MTATDTFVLDDFLFELPPSLIAQAPTDKRTNSRLLVYNKQTQTIQHQHFHQLGENLRAGDLLVMNNTRVMAARMFGQKSTGGKLELLVERILDEKQFVTQIKSSKSPKDGSYFSIDDTFTIQVIGRRESMFVCKVISTHSIFDVIRQCGHIPLPPYIERKADSADLERYQTVFSKHEGAVAAPTAGLHFDKPLLEALTQQGIRQDFLTLHVGAGTFQPVREQDISKHEMHSEWLEVNQSLVENINDTKKNGGRVIAVGTTVVRALETAALTGELKSFEGDSNIFLYPGKPFHVIDGMITNFHLPGSSLLMLVAAFIGLDNVKNLYREAIEKQYRFFSYGDASLLI